MSDRVSKALLLTGLCFRFLGLGEHGIGNDKAAYMPLVFGPDSMRLQWAVPAAFNPTHQLNPLKVFGHRRFAA